MPFDHATVRDGCEYLLAFALLSLVLVPPGFVVGWLGNVLDFRRRPLSGQFGLALLLSLAIVPIALHLVGTLLAFAAVWGALAIFWLAFPLVLLLRMRAEPVPDDPARLPVLLGSLLWLVLTGYFLVDLEMDGGLYRNMAHYDHAKHAAVTDAVLRTGLPPVNPSFRPGEDRPLYYYYFWQMLGGIVGRLGGDLVTPRTLALAGVAWAGIALIAAVALAVSRFTVPPTRRTYALAVALLLVTGLDIIPVQILSYSRFMPHLEWWNVIHVPAWVVLGLWIPHHLVGLTLIVLVGMLLREAADDPRPGRQALHAILAGVALASAGGISIWVTLTAGLCFALWGLVLLLKRDWREFCLLAVVGGVAAALLLPFVLELKRAQPETRFPLAFEVRNFAFLEDVNPTLAGIHPLLVPLFHLVMLPVNYAVELGVFLVAGLVYWRWRRQPASGGSFTRDELFLIVMTVGSLLVCAFFRSAIRNNDLGTRGTTMAQFCLLLATTALLSGTVPAPASRPEEGFAVRRLLVLLALIGFLGSGYELIMGRKVAPGDQGPEALEQRRAYEWIRANTPRDSVVQHSWKNYRLPTGGGFFLQPEGEQELFHLLYGHRQAAVSDEMHGMLFGVPPAQFDPVADRVARLFEAGTSREEAQKIADQFKIDVLVVKRADPIATDPTGWAAQTEPAYASASVRVYLLSPFPPRKP